MKKTTLKIDGMTCGHCKSAVERALQKLPDVESVVVDLESGVAIVSGETSSFTLIETIEAEGYDAATISDSV